MSELKRLAQLLNTTEEEIAFLGKLETNEVELLHKHTHQAIHQTQSPMWNGLARATHIFPDRVNARVAAHFIGPQATAQLTYHLSPQKALGIAKHFSIPFLADVLRHMEPQHSKPVIQAYPASKLRQLVRHLHQQEEYLLMGNFLAYLTPQQVANVLKEIDSEEAIAEIIAYSRLTTEDIPPKHR